MGFELFAQDIDVLQRDLHDFLVNSEARSVLLCDRGGNVILADGETMSESPDLISALTAGAFAATKELAGALGEDEFSAILHHGARTSMFISAIGEEALLLAKFCDDTNAGLVKMYGQSACRKIGVTFLEITRRDEIRIQDPTQTFTAAKGPIFESDD
jgi:predicted regulator of Ras-like GTPase activity (Roadblock/LC7/MglB family)